MLIRVVAREVLVEALAAGGDQPVPLLSPSAVRWSEPSPPSPTRSSCSSVTSSGARRAPSTVRSPASSSVRIGVRVASRQKSQSDGGASSMPARVASRSYSAQRLSRCASVASARWTSASESSSDAAPSPRRVSGTRAVARSGISRSSQVSANATSAIAGAEVEDRMQGLGHRDAAYAVVHGRREVLDHLRVRRLRNRRACRKAGCEIRGELVREDRAEDRRPRSSLRSSGTTWSRRSRRRGTRRAPRSGPRARAPA